MNTCKFCNKFARGADVSEETYDTVLYETENFVVTPTMGSLVEGWLLIISKSHYVSVGQLDLHLLKELEGIIETTTQYLKNHSKNVFVFEHGPSSSLQSVGCGIDHLHMHVVPLQFDLFEKANAYAPFFWNSANLLSTNQKFREGLPYLFLECPSGQKYITSDSNIPSQFFRRVIAHELGIEKYFDWKKNFGVENIPKTIKMLQDKFELV